MIELQLSKNLEITRLNRRFSIWLNLCPINVTAIQIRSFLHNGKRFCFLKGKVEDFIVLSVGISETDFRNIYNVFKPETKDELNILTKAEVETAGTDQVPAAGTNNAIVQE